MYLTVRSDIGGSTIVFSRILITIFHNSFRSLFSTVFSQHWANKVKDPSSKSIKGLNTSSAFPFICGFLTAKSKSPTSLTQVVIRGSKLYFEFIKIHGYNGLNL